MHKFIQSGIAIRGMTLGIVSLLGFAFSSLSEPAPSNQWATVLEIKGGNEAWVNEAGGRKRRLAAGDRVAMPSEIETGRNTRLLLDFPEELVALGDRTRGTLTFPGEVKVAEGTAATETKRGARHRPTIEDKQGKLEARANRTMVILHAPPEGDGNTKALLVHGDASFTAEAGAVERRLEPGQMVVVPEKGPPYCVHVDLEIATRTSKLIRDFEGHWNSAEIQEAIASQRGRFIQGVPFGIRRGDGPEERRLLSRMKKKHSHGH